MLPESADNQPFLWLTKQAVIHFWFIGSPVERLLQPALVIGLHTALLPFGEFILSHRTSLISSILLIIDVSDQKRYDTPPIQTICFEGN
ncbi:hypothetical protein XBO1_850007 [Xenorhabdus bovienii str. oregonense]|uniref:Uncharacterized protein n=1 Tax=Xenorhabdus bovienii str. oregonense TaxID=1398202 RepID=A0A077PE61_XENBV|nr:hypothetical protein XBO1_850007 [Xenorhabdus bovienii str. oregonense]